MCLRLTLQTMTAITDDLINIMFEGFKNETSDFLVGIMLNNERSWFNAHKDEYEKYLKIPFQALADDLIDLVNDKYPDEGFRCHVSRIYRDARRLYGRGPYKDHLWFTIFKGERDDNGPAFWFEISPDSYSYGMGFYMAHASDMDNYRKTIDANPAEFERLVKRFNRQNQFKLDGNDYKKPKGDAGELLNPWYNKRNLSLSFDDYFDEEALGPDLPKNIFEGMEFLMPFYNFFYRICHL